VREKPEGDRRLLTTPLLRSGTIILGGLLWGALCLVIGLYFTQDIGDGIDPKGFVPPSVWGRVPPGFTLLLVLPYVGAFMTSIVLLFKRSFLNAGCLISVVCSSLLPVYALDAIRGDRTHFTDGPHREITDIYRQRRADFVSPGPRFVPLDNQCHPPNWCSCWVAWDPSETSEVEQELGRWHQPRTHAFLIVSFPVEFSAVDVRRLEPHAYSALACGYTGG
jgi:hypothetical protein